MPAPTVYRTALQRLEKIHEGKVRDIYAIDSHSMLIVTSDRLSAHATYIHEDATMDAGAALALTGASPVHVLDTVRADISYSLAATVTPSIQYFRTTGTADINYWGTVNGSPNSDGMIFEIAYVPWGKPDSPFPNVNVRFAVQYVNYFSFDGTTANARNNNNFFFNIRTAMKF